VELSNDESMENTKVVELSNDEPMENRKVSWVDIVKKGENHKKGTNFVLVRRRKS